MASIILFGPLLVLWWATARSRSAGATVTGVIVAVGVFTELGRWLAPPAILEVTLAGLLLTLLTITVGRLVERARLGPATSARTGWTYSLAIAFGVLVLCGCWGTTYQPGPFYPAADLAGPIPAGLTAVENAGNCGSGLCSYSITVTARPGQSGADLHHELTGHIRTGCRPIGWLIDRRTACVWLDRPAGYTVGILLEGSRDPFDGGKSGPG